MKKKNLPKTFFELYEDDLLKMGYSFDEWALEAINNKEKFLEKFSEEQIDMLRTLGIYEMAGKKNFHLTEDLCYLLHNTTLEKMPAHLLHMPFNNFYIGGFGCLNFINNIDSVFIDRIIETELLEAHKKDHPTCDQPLFFLNFMLTSTINKQRHGGFMIPIFEGDILEQINEIIFDERYNYKPDLSKQDKYIKVIKFAFNCILYLTSENSIIEKITPIDYITKKKNKKKIKKAKKHSGTRLTQYRIGPTNIDRKLKQALIEHTHNPNPNQRHTDSWVVMGHWHPYWMLRENVKKWEWDEKKVIKETEDGTKVLVKKQIEPYYKGSKEKSDEKNYIVN